MKSKGLVLLLSFQLAPAVVRAQQAGPANTPAVQPPTDSARSATQTSALPDTPDASPTTPAADTQGARELPLDAEPFDVRVRRRVDEYHQRHQQREYQMSLYANAAGEDPSLSRFADPRKVQLEIDDELDRDQTSQELAVDYADQTSRTRTQAQALESFIAERRHKLDDLNKQKGAVHRQDLEVALANLARQPESPEAIEDMREMDRRLSETELNEKELPTQLAQNQQEADDAAQELVKLKTLSLSYDKQSKAFVADSLSARHNRLRLADKLEYYVVRAQAEDELEQGRKAMESVQHLAASPDVESTLNSSGSHSRSNANLEQLRDCLRQTDNVAACRDKIQRE
jgi:hypothetical protein